VSRTIPLAEAGQALADLGEPAGEGRWGITVALPRS